MELFLPQCTSSTSTAVLQTHGERGGQSSAMPEMPSRALRSTSRSCANWRVCIEMSRDVRDAEGHDVALTALVGQCCAPCHSSHDTRLSTSGRCIKRRFGESTKECTTKLRG